MCVCVSRRQMASHERRRKKEREMKRDEEREREREREREPETRERKTMGKSVRPRMHKPPFQLRIFCVFFPPALLSSLSVTELEFCAAPVPFFFVSSSSCFLWVLLCCLVLSSLLSSFLWSFSFTHFHSFHSLIHSVSSSLLIKQYPVAQFQSRLILIYILRTRKAVSRQSSLSRLSCQPYLFPSSSPFFPFYQTLAVSLLCASFLPYTLFSALLFSSFPPFYPPSVSLSLFPFLLFLSALSFIVFPGLSLLRRLRNLENQVSHVPTRSHYRKYLEALLCMASDLMLPGSLRTNCCFESIGV